MSSSSCLVCVIVSELVCVIAIETGRLGLYRASYLRFNALAVNVSNSYALVGIFISRKANYRGKGVVALSRTPSGHDKDSLTRNRLDSLYSGSVCVAQRFCVAKNHYTKLIQYRVCPKLLQWLCCSVLQQL